jgi:hypothetical protein
MPQNVELYNAGKCAFAADVLRDRTLENNKKSQNSWYFG